MISILHFGSPQRPKPLPAFQSVFHNTGLVGTCESCLENMSDLGAELEATNRDGRLTATALTHADRWRSVRVHLDEMQLRLEELPEKWKLYNQR